MKSYDSLGDLLEACARVRVVCVGDVMLDRFVYGDVTRLSPEAPVPVLLEQKTVETAGGAGNVAANLAGLGATVVLVSVVGDDAQARALEGVLAGLDGVRTDLLADPDRPTTCKTRFCGATQHLLRLDVEKPVPLSPVLERRLIEAGKGAMEGAGALLLSDYGKGVLTRPVLQSLIAAAKALSIPVIVDPKGGDYSRYEGASVVTPNKRELAQATGGLPVAGDDDIIYACRALMERARVEAVVATRSAEGMSVVEAAGSPLHIAAHARFVSDVSGAGDTVAACMAAALGAGASLGQAAMLASRAAGLVVEARGTAAVDAGALQEALDESAMRGRTLSPVLGWNEARARVEAWKAEGLSVGFTNGCFDILHRGHVMMLDACRARCDRLVLGLNTDASVRRLKGAARPVNGQDSRAAVVSALGSVDAVVLFGDDAAQGDTPVALIEVLRPAVIFKGSDYTEENVAGAGFVRGYGGRVELVPLEEGFSTTATLKKIGAV